MVLDRYESNPPTVRCLGSVIGTVVAEAATRPEVLDLMYDEIRFRVEFCPCSAVSDDYVQLEVTESKDIREAGRRSSVFSKAAEAAEDVACRSQNAARCPCR